MKMRFVIFALLASISIFGNAFASSSGKIGAADPVTYNPDATPEERKKIEFLISGFRKDAPSGCARVCRESSTAEVCALMVFPSDACVPRATPEERKKIEAVIAGFRKDAPPGCAQTCRESSSAEVCALVVSTSKACVGAATVK